VAIILIIFLVIGWHSYASRQSDAHQLWWQSAFSAAGPRVWNYLLTAAGPVIQPFLTVAENVYIRSLGPKCSVNAPLTAL